ncbi:TetR/AcrR family transcriptional regulator [Curtobacterium flaccumfaciens]|uniref:TetR/AcrR family transcriptional regulator n=1 Tax=Curtobacterium flaccumfaciens TaxID=2035 RepID=UPI001BDF91D5|nr:TetR/AcrR family transcriptional regulator [Curtobacterium flaccumfaciens]MBT1585529.1 TetR/AcrR family transcriptional regulator [Curtobacterium flaccumfaciens pv. flaccumfaciens]MCX2798851.1 TetR/AcrR family transcriptional regulator [Curtobacterium flaccumfaciens pv. flaccumfaciens]
MPRKPDPTRKPAILEKVVDHFVETKIEDVTVRGLGRVLGTSAYPVVYHFGSREALIDSVVEHLAAARPVATLDPDADADALADHLVAAFGGLDDPHRALAARLTFELGSVESLDGRDRQRRAHRCHVAAIRAWCRAHGADPVLAERAAQDTVMAARGAQWSALVDRAHTEADAALRRIAHDLASSTTGADRALSATVSTSGDRSRTR